MKEQTRTFSGLIELMPRRLSVPEQDVNSSRPKCCHHQPSKEIDLPAHKNHLLHGYSERMTEVILTPAVSGEWNNSESQKSQTAAFMSGMGVCGLHRHLNAGTGFTFNAPDEMGNIVVLGEAGSTVV